MFSEFVFLLVVVGGGVWGAAVERDEIEKDFDIMIARIAEGKVIKEKLGDMVKIVKKEIKQCYHAEELMKVTTECVFDPVNVERDTPKLLKEMAGKDTVDLLMTAVSGFHSSIFLTCIAGRLGIVKNGQLDLESLTTKTMELVVHKEMTDSVDRILKECHIKSTMSTCGQPLDLVEQITTLITCVKPKMIKICLISRLDINNEDDNEIKQFLEDSE